MAAPLVELGLQWGKKISQRNDQAWQEGITCHLLIFIQKNELLDPAEYLHRPQRGYCFPPVTNSRMVSTYAPVPRCSDEEATIR